MTDKNEKSIVGIVKGATNELGIKSTHYLIGAASLVAALSWNEAIKDSAAQIYPQPKDNYKFKLAYALVITILVILLVWMLPDTKKELPKETQEKIDELREKEKLQLQVNILNNEVDMLKHICITKMNTQQPPQPPYYAQPLVV